MKKTELSVDKIVEVSEGSIKSQGTASTITKFCSDTRTIENGDFFISLTTEQNAGIKYIEEAFNKGAVGCITQLNIANDLIARYKDKLIIQVKDIVKAIQNTAIYKRSLFNIPVIAITGSVGKTSTKDMIASVISQKYKTKKTQGNYNNHMGVPLTILEWDDSTEVAIVEMGMNHLGEISVLTNIAKPTIAVITNIGTAHIGILGSRENILKAKLEILEGLENDGKIIVNNDNDLLHNFNTEKYNKITYGIDNESDYRAEDIKIEEKKSEFKINIKNKEYLVNVPVAGEHFIYNSLCAIATGLQLNIEMNLIINGIEEFKLTEKRNEIIETNGIKLLNDYYNASFDSMKASLQVLSKINRSKKIAILGDMLELGDFSKELHIKVGQEAAKNNVDILITIGELSKDIAEGAKKEGLKEIYSFNNNNDCIEHLRKILSKGDVILLKASNRMNFGEISKYIQGEKLWQN